MAKQIHPDCRDCWCRDDEPCSCACHDNDDPDSTYLEGQE